MGPVIHFKGALPEIPFPCADTDNTAFPVMVVTAEKGKEEILSSVSRGTCQGCRRYFRIVAKVKCSLCRSPSRGLYILSRSHVIPGIRASGAR